MVSSIVNPGIVRNKPEEASCCVIQNKSFSWLWDNLKIGNHLQMQNLGQPRSIPH